MTPREITKKIRKVEFYASSVVTEMAMRVRLRIPTGFRPKAQGCEERATLGYRPENKINRNAVVAISVISRDVGHNPVGVDNNLISFTQGCTAGATSGQSSKPITTPTGLWQPA